MNKNVRSADPGMKKMSNRTSTGLHSSYMQRFLNTAAHKNLETALQQKLNFAFNRQRPLTPASKKELEIDYFDDDGHSPRYICAKERSTEKKSKKKSPESSPILTTKNKIKDVTYPLPKPPTKQAHSHKDSAKLIRDVTQTPNTGSKVKEPVVEVSKKPKVKGLNTLLHREPIVEMPMVNVTVKKAKEPVTVINKEKIKEVANKITAKKETLAKGDKKVSDTQRKGTGKSSGVKSRKVQ